MTHKQFQAFWREVCESYSMPKNERTERQESITAAGLCRAIKYSPMASRLNGNELHGLYLDNPYKSIIYSIFNHDNKLCGYWWNWGIRGSHHRSIAAGLLAAMSARDVEGFLND